jgi:hypothetical protein
MAPRSNIKKLDWRTFSRVMPQATAEDIAVIDEYFSHFVALEIIETDGVPVISNQKCVNCDETLDGLFGTFQWGIVHGQGMCGACHWPAYGHHFIKDGDGREIASIRNFILQVHPEHVTKK